MFGNAQVSPDGPMIRRTRPSRRISTASDVKYDMYLIPFETLEKLTEDESVLLPPHQTLLDRGDLIKWESLAEDEGATIVFVSHEWLGWKHPDPQSIQTRTLCAQLRNLKDGRHKKVQMSAIHRLVYNENKVTTAKEFKGMLQRTYVWYDWISMPQPDAETCEETKAKLRGPGLDAIRSIPAYVERADFMTILAPPGRHADRKDRITGEHANTSYSSWRKRGWCVLELYASMLSRDSKCPNLLIRSAEGTPQWIPPFDALTASCGLANYRCCEMGHTWLGKTVPCDKRTVHDILTKLLRTKVRHLRLEEKRTEMARAFSVMSHWWLRNLVTSSSSLETESAPRDCSNNPTHARDVKSFQSSIWWTGDLASIDKNGMSLLTYAAAANNPDVVETILKTMSSTFGHDTKRMRDQINRSISDDGIVEIGWPGRSTALHAAMCFASPRVVSLLLEYGADPKRYTVNGMCPFITSCCFDREDNVNVWLRKLPTWDVNARMSLTV